MARPTWDELRPKVALLRQDEAVAEAAAREAARLLEARGLTDVPPGWRYDPDERRWLYRSAAGEATLCWLPPDDYGGGEWNYTWGRADGKSGGGGLLRPLRREQAMALVVQELSG